MSRQLGLPPPSPRRPNTPRCSLSLAPAPIITSWASVSAPTQGGRCLRWLGQKLLARPRQFVGREILAHPNTQMGLKESSEGKTVVRKKKTKNQSRASLVAQWLRIRLPMQGTWVRALVREDPTCRGAAKPVRRNYCCLLYTSPSPRDRTRSRMPSSA